MQQFSRWNKGYRYLLMFLDIFSKYGWIVLLKDKKGKTVSKAFETILKKGRKPKFLWTDKGKEYFNKYFQELLDKHKYNFIQLKMSKSQVFVNDGIELLKALCGNNLLFKIILLVMIFYLIFSMNTTIPNIQALK